MMEVRVAGAEMWVDGAVDSVKFVMSRLPHWNIYSHGLTAEQRRRATAMIKAGPK